MAPPKGPGSQEQDADEGRCDEGVIYGRNRFALDRAPRAKRGWEQIYGCTERAGVRGGGEGVGGMAGEIAIDSCLRTN